MWCRQYYIHCQLCYLSIYHWMSGSVAQSAQCGLVRTGSVVGLGPARWCELSFGWTSSARTLALGVQGLAGVGVCALLPAQPQPRVSEWACGHQAAPGCHQPLRGKILSPKWTSVAIPYSPVKGTTCGETIQERNCDCGWLWVMSYDILPNLGQLICHFDHHFN